jgi:molybdopterin synthase catalytic subunit
MDVKIRLEVLYFAHVRERVGASSETFELDAGSTVQDAVNCIVAKYPTLFELLPHIRVALDGEFVGLGVALPARGELVLIPPVAGGSESAAAGGHVPAESAVWPVWIGDEALTADRVAALVALVAGVDRGGIVCFEGRVRNHARGQAVTALEYEAYRPMALSQMRKIVAEVEREYPGTRCAMHHRVGPIPIGENAVVAVASHAHRAPAFDACQRLIERLKQDVPIWKRETAGDGATWVSERP